MGYNNYQRPIPFKLTEKECQFLFVILDKFKSYYRE